MDHDHSAMDMDMDMGDDSCQISMLWNWNTINACFITDGWKIRTTGQYVGTIIGVLLIGLLVELTRRFAREYDVYLVRVQNSKESSRLATFTLKTLFSSSQLPVKGSEHTAACESKNAILPCNCRNSTKIRPTILQQAARSTLHTIQFVGAYFLMLLAMYYNGGIILAIFAGAFIGHFLFAWDTIGIQNKTESGTACC
jgi:copper transporter 1